MDLSKYPLEKVLHIVASVLPGFVALSIYGIAVPGVYRWFWSLNSVGYRTKLAVVLTVALLVGTTVNTLVNVILYCIGYAAGKIRKQRQDVMIAPWRDPAWRAALSKVLSTPPKDTEFWFPAAYELKKKQIEFCRPLRGGSRWGRWSWNDCRMRGRTSSGIVGTSTTIRSFFNHPKATLSFTSSVDFSSTWKRPQFIRL